MPASTPGNLVQYRYDPLDRQVGCVPFGQATIQRFYCKTRIATEIQGSVQHSIVQYEDQLLAQRRCEDSKDEMTLLATDLQRSVLRALDSTTHRAFAYTPYGHHPLHGLLGLPGFNGERPDPLTGHYHLGNGYRAFNPVLMRFTSPDNMSPFDKGGLNAYAYCEGEPISNSDPDGHFIRSVFVKPFLNKFTSRQSSSYIARKLRTAKVVNLDGEPIKVPKVFLGDEYASLNVDISKRDYVELVKVKLKIDRFRVQVEREKGLFRKEVAPDVYGYGETKASQEFKYFSRNANSAPMRKLLGSIESLDNALAANKKFTGRTDSITNNASSIRR